MKPQSTAPIRPDQIHPELIAEARGWVADCDWAENRDYALDADEFVAELSDRDVVRGVTRHYAGGWGQFTQDVRGWSREKGWGPLPGSDAWRREQEQAATR